MAHVKIEKHWRDNIRELFGPDPQSKLELAMFRYLENTSGFPRTADQILNVVLDVIREEILPTAPWTEAPK